jgi:S-methylmethionine-dependent homocysteine/selenocysteine methylase
MSPCYRHNLPQLSADFFLADGGLETTLMFHEGLELPHLASIAIVHQQQGIDAIRRYCQNYIDIARKHQVGISFDTTTWRASSDWGEKLGYTPDQLAEANRLAVRILEEVRDEYETPNSPIVIAACIGPRGDGYRPEFIMPPDEAQQYHQPQIDTFAETAADYICAMTMTHAGEAIGVVRAARQAGMPVAISFTVETDGRLPTGQALGEAIIEVEDATNGYAAYFMINCALWPCAAGARRADGVGSLRSPGDSRAAQHQHRRERTAVCLDSRRGR